MSEKIRVMLCDDSSTMRRLIKTALRKDERIEVVFEAQNGKEALDNLDSAAADIIVMDIEMPVMDGIDATRAIKKRDRSIPVVMFSSLTTRGAEATLDELAAGANDFITKPAASGHINNALERLQADLIPKITDLCLKSGSTKPLLQTGSPNRLHQSANQEDSVKSIDLIAIGVSTGGPQALAEVLSGLPQEFPVPVLITQHMPPVFTKLLAQRLSVQSGHEVCEAKDGEEVRPGRILIAPGDYHLVVKQAGGRVLTQLNQDSPENSCRPSVDPFFRSIAKCYGQRALGVVLTGMGEDGTSGAGEIKRQGGSVYVQDEESSVVWGMPSKVLEAGFADRTFALSQLAPELTRVANLNRQVPLGSV